MNQSDDRRIKDILRRVELATGEQRPPRDMPPHGQTFLSGFNYAVEAGDPSWYAITQGLGQAATIFILDLVEAMQAVAKGAVTADDASFLAQTLERRWQQETAAVHATLLDEVAAIRRQQRQSH